MKISQNSAVEVQDLVKRFGSFTAVNHISFHVESGRVFGFLGPNGAGKSTTIKILCGILTPTSGTGTVGGFDVLTQQNKIRQNIGYMSQKFSLYEDLTVRENITFFAEMCGRIDRAWIDEVLELVELKDRSRSLVRTLSGGLKQRTSLACSLAHKPRLLLLDEPTVGIDPQLRATFWSYFRQLASSGVTLIVSSHVMDEAERCDRLGFMRLGKLLAEGSASELRDQANARTLEEAFLRFAVGNMEGGEG